MDGFDFERALKLLMGKWPEEKMKKPTLFHSVRVGSYLFQNGYSIEICISGLLHDSIEDTTITKELIEKEFGKHVAEIVFANSHNLDLPKSEKLLDIVKRCNDYSIDALIVKVSDIYDNFIFYKRLKESGNEMIGEVDRCKKLASLVLKHKKDIYNDKIFDLLDEVLEY